MLHIQLLGDFRLTYDDEPVAAANSQRLQSLLAYLVLKRGAPTSRQTIAYSFWPDSREKQTACPTRQVTGTPADHDPPGKRGATCDTAMRRRHLRD